MGSFHGCSAAGSIRPPMYWKSFPKPCSSRFGKHHTISKQAETREKAYEAFDKCITRFNPRYPKTMECLAKDKNSMLAFYDYSDENWQYIRTTNSVETDLVK